MRVLSIIIPTQLWVAAMPQPCTRIGRPAGLDCLDWSQ